MAEESTIITFPSSTGLSFNLLMRAHEKAEMAVRKCERDLSGFHESLTEPPTGPISASDLKRHYELYSLFHRKRRQSWLFLLTAGGFS